MKHRSLEIIRDEHSSLAAMLQSMRMLVDRGPGDDPKNFFDVLRAMLFYIDEFPERLHHPKETELLFPAWLPPRPRWAWPLPGSTATTSTPRRPCAISSTC
ncbi:hemerythrin domain-containing protein [Ottowia beijingensis]|uniref:hemerythrin domain-containing protein n=1 Tax=Ottowia beijingensis TaxID=1207057 RepID=UPI0027DA617A|nr:hypothetical protein [Ottowia beijingensis]